eukprot:COSAG01_NODE_833_length_13236_cov_1041.341022_5_plen_140_part_00
MVTSSEQCYNATCGTVGTRGCPHHTANTRCHSGARRRLPAVTAHAPARVDVPVAPRGPLSPGIRVRVRCPRGNKTHGQAGRLRRQRRRLGPPSPDQMPASRVSMLSRFVSRLLVSHPIGSFSLKAASFSWPRTVRVNIS